MDPEKFSGFLLLYDRCICQYSVGSAALAEVLGLRVFLVKYITALSGKIRVSHHQNATTMDFTGAKDVRSDNWSFKMCKGPV